jgi:hypothetical protein
VSKNFKLALLLGVAAALLAWPAASLAAGDITGPAPDGKVYVCHATSDASGVVQHYDLLTISIQAAFSNTNGGHFNEDGSATSGHENDFVLLYAGQTITAAHGAAFKFGLNCETAVLAATLRSLTAHASARTLNVHWQTASETNVAGYNVYGVVNGHRTKLNARIIASKGSNGHAYAFSYHVPRGKQAPSRILLQVVNLDGSRQLRSAAVS